MASPQFDSNTWYSLQNSGTSFYLDCNVVSICGAGTSAQTNFEFFQIAQPDSSLPFYIRPKAENADQNGRPFCINLSTGQPFLSLCNNASATWGTGFWNGQNSADGLFFYSTQRGDSQRLSLKENGVWSLPDYNSVSAGGQDQMRWNVASLAAINDQSYSTVPAVITGSGSAIATSTSTATSSSTSTSTSSPQTITSTSSSSASTSSTGSSFSFGSSSGLSTSGSSSSPTTSARSTGEPTSTTVVVVTPTSSATSGHTTSGTSTAPTTSITLASAATKTRPHARILVGLAALVFASQIGQWLV